MLDSLHIKNFRCFEDLTIPSLGRVNLIVGRNNSGKSTLLEAIAVFAQRGHIETLFNILESKGEFLYSEAAPSINLKQIEKIFFAREAIQTGKELYIGNVQRSDYVHLQYKLLEDNRYGISNGIKIESNLRPLELSGSKFEHDILANQNFLDKYPHTRVNTTIELEENLAVLWDKVKIAKQTNTALNALQIIDPKIEEIFFTRDNTAMLSLTNEKTALPLRSMGEGLSRLLQIFLHAFQACGGYLMIDEFENGLHYSIQEEVWKKLVQLAEELDIQVFATTHSEDAIKAFFKVALKSEDEQEARLISLGRSVGKSDYGKIFATVFDREDLGLISTTGIEVR